LLVVASACQAIASGETEAIELKNAAKETMYNLMNYPDEINITPQ
jgi:hypothetical protein